MHYNTINGCKKNSSKIWENLKQQNVIKYVAEILDWICNEQHIGGSPFDIENLILESYSSSQDTLNHVMH